MGHPVVPWRALRPGADRVKVGTRGAARFRSDALQQIAALKRTGSSTIHQTLPVLYALGRGHRIKTVDGRSAIVLQPHVRHWVALMSPGSIHAWYGRASRA